MYVDIDDGSDNSRCRMQGTDMDTEMGTGMNTETGTEMDMEMNMDIDAEMNTEIDTEKESGYELTAGQRKYLPVKRAADVVLAGAASVVLAPLMGALALAIKLDSPGPVLFKQKRVGKDKKTFEIWKFRTMRTDTPKDVPTHLLENPDTYITRTGRFMRKYSLDELPQFWQVLTSDLSIVGPRPALWNQDDLIAGRDKYGANGVKPGITGWAQVNGRDELEIDTKARFDGEYVKQMGPLMDAKCFLATIGAVLCHDGVVEGGTGELHKADTGELDKTGSGESYKSGSGETDNAGTSEPCKLGPGKPDNAGTSEPGKLGPGKPDNAGTSEPRKLGSCKPDKEGIGEPHREGEKTGEPGNVSDALVSKEKLSREIRMGAFVMVTAAAAGMTLLALFARHWKRRDS